MAVVDVLRTTWLRVTLAVVCIFLLGVAGASLAAEVVLLTMRLPESAKGRAWRTLGLITFSAGLVAGLLGVVVWLLVGDPLIFAVIFGGVVGAAGLTVGALAGAVVSFDQYRREVVTP